jgi:subtilisin family serine protease
MRILALFMLIGLTGLTPVAKADTAEIARLRAENAALRAEVLRLRSAPQSCASLAETETALAGALRKLGRERAALDLARLHAPGGPGVLPPELLSARVPGQYIVELAQAGLTSPSDHEQGFGLPVGSVLHVYSRVLNGFSVRGSPDLAARLDNDPRVVRVAQDGFIFPAQVSAPVLAPVPPEGKAFRPDVTVWVFDSGIRATHDLVAGRTSPGFTSIRNGIGTEDCNGHGTHIAAMIGGHRIGRTDRAELVSVKVMDRDNYGTVSTFLAGVEWVLEQPRRLELANLSLTRLEPDPPQTAWLDRGTEALIAAGIPVVTAAGNAGMDAALFSPARVAGAITVGAYEGDRIADYSNAGQAVTFYAEGRSRSADLSSLCALRDSTGTSNAAARVSGIVAGLLADGTEVTNLRNALLSLARPEPTGAFAGEIERMVLTDGHAVADIDEACDSVLSLPNPDAP